mgnify:FL=1
MAHAPEPIHPNFWCLVEQGSAVTFAQAVAGGEWAEQLFQSVGVETAGLRSVTHYVCDQTQICPGLDQIGHGPFDGGHR